MTPIASKEFDLVLNQLIDLFKPVHLDAVGVFHWEHKEEAKGRRKRTYVRTILRTNKTENSKSYQAWFILLSENKVELIIDFKLTAVPMGEVTLYEFKRNEEGLKKTKSKILSLR